MGSTPSEEAFRRALLLTASKKKLFLAFIALSLSAILTTFSRAALFGAGHWVATSFYFLPILISSGILFILGVLLIRIHHHEAKGLKIYLQEIVKASLDLMVGAGYLALFPVLIYFFLWIGLGIFFLLQAIPGLGDFLSVIFSFGPFLLILGSIILCALNIVILFFVTPAAALHSLNQVAQVKELMKILMLKPLKSCQLFFLGIFPITIMGIFLSFAAWMTGENFLVAEQAVSIALEWFFIGIPFCAFLAPFVVFFFNFSAESYQLLKVT